MVGWYGWRYGGMLGGVVMDSGVVGDIVGGF